MSRAIGMCGLPILPKVGSHAINGVAALHSELFEADSSQRFSSEFSPEKFSTKPRRNSPSALWS
jgi:glucan phosphorylase